MTLTKRPVLCKVGHDLRQAVFEMECCGTISSVLTGIHGFNFQHCKKTRAIIIVANSSCWKMLDLGIKMRFVPLFLQGGTQRSSLRAVRSVQIYS